MSVFSQQVVRKNFGGLTQFVRISGVFAAASVAFWSGCAMAPSAPPAALVLSWEQRLAHNRRVFDRAWELVNDKFFDAEFRGVDWPVMQTRYRPDAENAKD